MKNLIKTISITFSLSVLMSCEPDNNPPNANSSNCTDGVFNQQSSYGQVVDVDGNEYKTILIGNQNWMAENLRTSHYRNGEEIPNLTDPEQWSNTVTGAWIFYQNNPENACPKGKLYNFYTVFDDRGLCPDGWHIPTEAEWNELLYAIDPQVYINPNMNSFGNASFSDPNAVKSLLSVGTNLNPTWMFSYYDSSSPGEIFYTPASGMTNTTGLSVVSTGTYYSSPGQDYHEFEGLNESVKFWTQSSFNPQWSSSQGIYKSIYVGQMETVGRMHADFNDGNSCRCIED